MKQLFCLLLFCSAAPVMFAQRNNKLTSLAMYSSVTEWLGVSGPLQFNKTSFNLAWSDKPNATYYVQEYTPAGENVERFNQLLTINLFNKTINTKEAVNQKLVELSERKKTDPNCNYAISQSKDGKEFLVDFLLSEGTGSQEIVEFNIYRYKQITMADGKSALLVYAYSKRSYGNAVAGFLKNLKTERPALLQAMSTVQLPQIKISNK